MLFMLKRTAKFVNKPIDWGKFRAAINQQGVAIIHYAPGAPGAPDAALSIARYKHHGVSIISLDHIVENNTWQVTDVFSEQYANMELPVKTKNFIMGCIGQRYIVGHVIPWEFDLFVGKMPKQGVLNQFSGLNTNINKPFISTMGLAKDLLSNRNSYSLEDLDNDINLSGISLPGFAEKRQQIVQPHISLECALTTAKLFLYLTWAINEKILDERLLAPVALPKQRKPTPR